MISTSFNSRTLCLALAMSAIAAGPVVAKDCDAILAEGLRNTYNFSDNSSFDRSIHSAVCSNRSLSSDSSSSFGVNIPLVEIGSMLGFDASSSNARQRVESYCNTFGDLTNRQAAISWTRTVVDDSIVSAWESCQAETGFICLAEPLSGNDFQVTIAWNRTNVGAGTLRAVLVADAAMSNASCPTGQLTQGVAVEDSTERKVVCSYNDPGQTAYVTLNSTQGAATCAAAARVAKNTAIDFMEECLEGTESACLGLLQEAGQAGATCAKLEMPLEESTPGDIEQSRARFAAEIWCSNFRTGVAATQLFSAEMLDACHGAIVVQARCNEAKQVLQSVAQTTLNAIEEVKLLEEKL